MSIRENMYDALAGNGITVCLPGQHDGVCTEPYVVISDGGVIRLGRTTGRKAFYVTGYVPMARPLDLRELLASATTALAALRDVRTTGEVSPEDIDDEIGALFASIEYTALCSI